MYCGGAICVGDLQFVVVMDLLVVLVGIASGLNH